ncbi:MAG: gluconate 2-dehydrogenase subunit 3 family protein [Tepidisphaeraceae bacterium]|jgi:gluconate 2-dehydrogenase gamma chain
MEEPEPTPPQTPPTSPPPPPPCHTRRTLVKLAVIGAIGAAAGAGSAAIITHMGHAAPPRYRFFSEAEASLLIAICEQIIPGDDAPGATDAGVIHYIDRQLSGALARHQRAYRLGLESFRKTCLQVHKKPFEKLAFATQTEALRLIEAGKGPKELWGSPSQQEFFNLVIDHTMQGFYGSPRHGGNRDYASYRMLGLAYPNIIGQNRYASAKQP